MCDPQNKQLIEHIGQIPFTSFLGGPVSVDFNFQTMLGSKEYNHNILSSMKSTLIPTYRIINLQIYRTNLHTFITDANPDGKGCPTASKLVKESEDIYCMLQKSYFYFYVLFILWCEPRILLKRHGLSNFSIQ